MRRRDFVAFVSGTAAWPFAARGQDRLRPIAVLNTLPADDAHSQERIGVFQQALAQASPCRPSPSPAPTR